MIVVADVEDYQDCKSFHELIAAGHGDPTLSASPDVRFFNFPSMENIVEDWHIDTGHELRWFRRGFTGEVNVGFVEEITDSVIVVSHLENGWVERIPYVKFFNPILIIDPYQFERKRSGTTHVREPTSF